MSNVKADLLKQIENSVTRKKQLAKVASREKTIAYLVSEFFTEYQKVKRLGAMTSNVFSSLAVSKLTSQLRMLDRNCFVLFKEPEGEETPTIEIHWSSSYSLTNNCEDVLVFDASSAYFQSAIENIQIFALVDNFNHEAFGCNIV